MVDIITGVTQKPIASESLKAFFATHTELSGQLYIGYPIMATITGAFPLDAIWISANKGIVAFHLVEGSLVEGYQQIQDDYYNKIEAKLRNHSELVAGRSLLVDINIITYMCATGLPENIDRAYPVCDSANLTSVISSFSWANSSKYAELVSVLQSVSTIRKPNRKRNITKSMSRGAKLQSLEDSIANLDATQSRAVIETVEGVQRIRGLAGSGKTIVLALKAAYLHAQHPEWKIVVTFNTRSLKEQFRKLIYKFCLEQTRTEPDWDNLQIIHAWGSDKGKYSSGVYFNYCMSHGVECLDYIAAKEKFGQAYAFDGACNQALSETVEVIPQYDAILVDEAQDFSSSFLNICYALLKEPKRLVYAYDELQNLGVQSLSAPEELFGNTSEGKPRVVFSKDDPWKPQQDIILEKCYRNSRLTLVTAHALGFGIYRQENLLADTALVQMFDRKELWEDVGYSVKSGVLEYGQQVVLQRTAESSPIFLENHSAANDMIQFIKFQSKKEQADWLIDQIQTNLRDDELNCDDIMVVNTNPFSTRQEFSPIRKALYDLGIESHVAGVDTAPDVFFSSDDNSIAFTGIYRAKGNEAGMVYIINAQDCFNSDTELARIRNRLFTAITRSKAWVRVVGVGSDMDGLISEYAEIVNHEFCLDFNYPTLQQLKTLKVINRDMSAAEKDKVVKGRKGLSELLHSLEAGEFYLDDLGKEQVRKLRQIIDEGVENE